MTNRWKVFTAWKKKKDTENQSLLLNEFSHAIESEIKTPKVLLIYSSGRDYNLWPKKVLLLFSDMCETNKHARKQKQAGQQSVKKAVWIQQYFKQCLVKMDLYISCIVCWQERSPRPIVFQIACIST